MSNETFTQTTTIPSTDLTLTTTSGLPFNINSILLKVSPQSSPHPHSFVPQRLKVFVDPSDIYLVDIYTRDGRLIAGIGFSNDGSISSHTFAGDDRFIGLICPRCNELGSRRLCSKCVSQEETCGCGKLYLQCANFIGNDISCDGRFDRRRSKCVSQQETCGCGKHYLECANYIGNDFSCDGRFDRRRCFQCGPIKDCANFIRHGVCCLQIY